MEEKKKKKIDIFFEKLKNYICENGDTRTREIYDLFPEMKRKTVSWTLYKLVQMGLLYREEYGYYTINESSKNISMGYDYLNFKSRDIYEEAQNYGFHFYISGIDGLSGELLHMPEDFPTIVVTEKDGIQQFLNVFSQKGLLVIEEKNNRIIKNNYLNRNIDIILLRGKNFSLSTDNIADKEKSFVDLYYAVTRLEYPLSVQELVRIYENLVRNKHITNFRFKKAAKDRGIQMEMEWIIGLDKYTEKTKSFMKHMIMGENDGLY